MSLTQPLLLQNIISYKGFKALAFVGGSADNVYSIDYDLNRMFWKAPVDRRLRGRHRGVPGALTTITRAAAIAPPAPGGRGGRGGGGGGGFGGGNANVFAISSGGMVHVLNVQTGEDLNPPIKFLPAGARWSARSLPAPPSMPPTTGACGGAANGVYALDLANNANTVKSGTPRAPRLPATSRPTFGTDGTCLRRHGSRRSATSPTPSSRSIGTGLTAKDWFAGSHAVRVSPGRLPASGQRPHRGGQSRRPHLPARQPPRSAGRITRRRSRSRRNMRLLAISRPARSSTWQDAAGTRWIAVPSGAAPAGEVKTAAANGAVTSGALVAFKLGAGATPTLEPGWISRDLVSPTAPLVMNGVVFVVSGGGAPSTPQMTPAQRAQRSKPAVLYALDASTGKELWTSGTAMTSPVFGVGPSGGDGQVYVVDPRRHGLRVRNADGALILAGSWKLRAGS